MRTGETPGQTNLVEIRKKDGNTIFLEVNQRPLRGVKGEVTGIIGSLRDVTERKQTREALEKSERLYRMLAENVTDVIWTADMNLRFTYVSPSHVELRGYTSEEVIGQPLEDVLTPASYQRAIQAFKEALTIEKAGGEELIPIPNT